MYSTFSTNGSSNGSRSGRQDVFKKKVRYLIFKKVPVQHIRPDLFFRFQSGMEHVSYSARRDEVDF